MANISNNAHASKYLEQFKKRTSGSIYSNPVTAMKPTLMGSWGCVPKSPSIFGNLYGERNRILCQSEFQLNNYYNSRGGVSYVSASDYYGSGAYGGTCGGGSCNSSNKMDWKDMTLMTLVPQLAQVAVAGIAQLFGINLPGMNNQTQAANGNQNRIFDTNGQQPTNTQGGVNSPGAPYPDGGGTPAVTTPEVTTPAATTPAVTTPATETTSVDKDTPAAPTSTTATGTDSTLAQYEKDGIIKPVVDQKDAIGKAIDKEQKKLKGIEAAMKTLDNKSIEEDEDVQGLQNKINGMDEKIGDAQGKVEASETSLKNLNKTLGANKAAEANAQKALDSLGDEPEDETQRAAYNERKAVLQAELARATKEREKTEGLINDEQDKLNTAKEELQAAKKTKQGFEKALVDLKNTLDKESEELRNQYQADKTECQDNIARLEVEQRNLQETIDQHNAREDGKKGVPEHNYENGEWTGTTVNGKEYKRNLDNVVTLDGTKLSPEAFAGVTALNVYSGKASELTAAEKRTIIDAKIDLKKVTDFAKQPDGSLVVTINNDGSSKQIYIYKDGDRYVQADLSQAQ